MSMTYQSYILHDDKIFKKIKSVVRCNNFGPNGIYIFRLFGKGCGLHMFTYKKKHQLGKMTLAYVQNCFFVEKKTHKCYFQILKVFGQRFCQERTENVLLLNL